MPLQVAGLGVVVRVAVLDDLQRDLRGVAPAEEVAEVARVVNSFKGEA